VPEAVTVGWDDEHGLLFQLLPSVVIGFAFLLVLACKVARLTRVFSWSIFTG
jgi:hypothetical protein